MNQKLQKQITSKLETLEKVIEKIPAKLKEALALLEDKKDKKLDDWGQPIILEVGILSLLDD
ncbi:9308_t:CDS:2 [Ambispora gerdemannii]|uniref:9308_t:CDS:1 n=1 Tax=Ambispora gerdemannii TaxID=144530 RepID=A0A9N9GTQ4_9GLOM|nr:9308_t:CDS:2 [Ambispora gerdemannii]